MYRTATNNTTLQRNETEAMRTEKSGEEERPESRTISTARSPSAERSNGLQGQILPIVEELGEASSTGGRSATSRERNGDVDYRPVTPLKDYPPSIHANGTPVSMKRTINRSSLDKDLPPLPMGDRQVVR